jgi:protein-disulfide isomerase
MHELLFRHQRALTDDDLRRYATDLGLDVARFDLDRAGVGGRVRQDVESGMASGEVRGTPALFIDDAVHREAYDAATLREAVAR